MYWNVRKTAWAEANNKKTNRDTTTLRVAYFYVVFYRSIIKHGYQLGIHTHNSTLALYAWFDSPPSTVREKGIKSDWK